MDIEVTISSLQEEIEILKEKLKTVQLQHENACDLLWRTGVQRKDLEALNEELRRERDALRCKRTVSLDMIRLLRRLWINEPMFSFNFLLYKEGSGVSPSAIASSNAVQKEFNDLINLIDKEIIGGGVR